MNRLMVTALVLALGAGLAWSQEYWELVGNDIVNTNPGKVGVGAAPDAGTKLDVAGLLEIGVSAQPAYFRDQQGSTGLNIQATNSNYLGMKFNTKFQLIDGASGHQILHVFDLANGGYVGIGDQLTNPSEKLTVAGKVYSTSGGFKFPDSSVQTTAAFGDGYSLDASDGNPINALYVDAEGRVGIGTTSPSEKITIAGMVYSTAGGFRFPDGSLQTTAASAYSLSAADGDPHQVVYVDNSGHVGIGTTVPAATAKLDVIGRTRTSELEITGGSDLAEPFDFFAAGDVVPGIVASIDPERPGQLRVSSRAYDRTVVGVVSGAEGVKPGLIMGQDGTTASGRYPVALTGRVYVLADASSGAIVPGDLLTTSDRPGHVMKVTDHERANGAILGKAMSGLDAGEGTVLMVVALQ